MSLTEAIAQSIATMEGFFKAGTVAQRNHNPGNLRSWGNYPVVGGYVQFPDDNTGWQALYTQVNRNIDRGLTLQEFFGGKPGVYAGYSPSADANDPRGYAQYVAGQVGIAPTVVLNTVADSDVTGPPPNPTRPPARVKHRR